MLPVHSPCPVHQVRGQSPAVIDRLPFVTDALQYQRVHADATIHAQDICSAIERVGTQCLTCVTADRRFHEHRPSECRYSKGKCLRCLSPTHCTADGVRPCRVNYEKGVCFGCGLPNKVGGTEIHRQAFGKTCGHPLQDRLFPLAFYIFRDDRLKVELEARFERKWDDDAQFAKRLTSFADAKLRILLSRFFFWACNRF